MRKARSQRLGVCSSREGDAAAAAADAAAFYRGRAEGICGLRGLAASLSPALCAEVSGLGMCLHSRVLVVGV